MRYVIARIVLAFDVTFVDGFDQDAFREGIFSCASDLPGEIALGECQAAGGRAFRSFYTVMT